MSILHTSHESVDLAALGRAIDAEADAAVGAARVALEHARRCGELLLHAKAAVKHGMFATWLAANCRVKDRQARVYMAVAKNWSTIESKSAPGAVLTIKQAMKLLARPTAVAPQAEHDADDDVTLARFYRLPMLDDETVLTGILPPHNLTIVVPVGGGYFHVSHFDHTGEELFTRRGCINYAVPQMLKAMDIPAPAFWRSEPYAEWIVEPFNAELLENAAAARRQHLLGRN